MTRPRGTDALAFEALLGDGELVGSFESYIGLRPAWMADAACREHPEIVFFPERGDDVRPAKALCAGCLVRLECLSFAVESGDIGIWGGTSERERRRMRREAA